MRLATIRYNSSEIAGIITTSGILLIHTINRFIQANWPIDMFSILESGKLDEIKNWYQTSGISDINKLKEHILPFNQINYAPLYRHPRKIWGIGLNYVEHASDLSEVPPTIFPASFMKPDSTIIGHEDLIKIPPQSKKITGEAELGIVIGKTCKSISPKEWTEVIAGFTPIIDITAEDLIRKNPRYITLAKSFDTFFSFGPHLVTADEISNLSEIKVATVLNGEIYARNSIKNMTFSPANLVSFHSEVMTLYPGDIISTGTPRAVQIQIGDVIECQIDTFPVLRNPVRA